MLGQNPAPSEIDGQNGMELWTRGDPTIARTDHEARPMTGGIIHESTEEKMHKTM